MATYVWDAETAADYDASSPEMFDPARLDPCVDVLAALAGDGPALEFAVGTGRVALPLSARGVPVSGIELDTLDGPVGQLFSSHHWTLLDGRWVQGTGHFRYVWPSELDLMARLAGFRLEHRWGGWDRSPFTAGSASQVAVYRKSPDR